MNRNQTFQTLLIQEVKRRSEISTEYRNQIDTAKTTTKKNYFLKKLKKNNVILAQMLARLDYMEKTAPDAPTSDVPVSEAAPEETISGELILNNE